MALVGKEDRVGIFLKRSITPGTGDQDQYSSKWKRCVKFVDSLPAYANAGIYPERWNGNPRAGEERLACLLIFMEWMYSEEGLRMEQVKGVMTADNTTMSLGVHTCTGLLKNSGYTMRRRRIGRS
jgi:hypothetical protein